MRDRLDSVKIWLIRRLVGERALVINATVGAPILFSAGRGGWVIGTTITGSAPSPTHDDAP